MNRKGTVIYFLLLLVFSCKSIKKQTEVDSTFQVKTLESKTYTVLSFKVTPLERAVNGSFFRFTTGVKYIRDIDTYVYGGDIEYNVEFEIIIDSLDQRNKRYQLDDIRIFKKRSKRLYSDTLSFDSIFIIPTFSIVNSKKNQELTQKGNINVSHYSSSRMTNVLFLINDKEVVIKTHFTKPMVPGG